MELDNAPLPPPVKRGRKPTVVTYSTPSGSEDGWVRKAFEAEQCGAKAIQIPALKGEFIDAWVTGPIVNRYPTEGHTMLVGGRFNGQSRDMRPYNGAKFVALPLDNGDVDWYERGERDGYYWVASVYPTGIELRLTI